MGGGDGKIGGSVDFHLSLSPRGFDSLAAKLLERGCLLEKSVHQGADGTTFIEVMDPDGNALKVMRAQSE
jgi:hypothetical protein